MKANGQSYCQFLSTSQTNYTLTYLSDHTETLSHDAINRYLSQDKITPNRIWEHAKGDVVFCPNGYIIFDDTVLDKNHSHKIELVRRQYSGNAHGIIKGVGVVNCVYVNSNTQEYWVLDYRIFDPDVDGKTKLDHVSDMLDSLIHRQVPFTYVLMDTWYATKRLMLFIESLGKIYYCPLKTNRLVDDSDGVLVYRSVDQLNWHPAEEILGKRIKIKGFPKNHKVKLFRVAATNRTEWIVSNDPAHRKTQEIQDACSLRWKVEQFHRELKQITGIEKCQCRKARIQRNHIACAMLVWLHLKRVAKSLGATIYQVKNDLLSSYMRRELKYPSFRMPFV